MLRTANLIYTTVEAAGDQAQNNPLWPVVTNLPGATNAPQLLLVPVTALSKVQAPRVSLWPFIFFRNLQQEYDFIGLLQDEKNPKNKNNNKKNKKTPNAE